jgi:N-acetylglucosamine kinase-like BadF-type ATPase
MSQLYLGVDAGNSKTLAVVGDEHGNILGWGRSGLGDIYGVVEPSDAVDEVTLAIARARSAAALGAARDIRPFDAAAFRLAGVDWAEDETYWMSAIAERFGGPTRVSVKNDGYALLRCGDPRGVGVALSVGTGAAMAGRGIDGSEFVVSWWFQHYLGGAGLGHEAMHAVMLAELGIGPATLLSERLCEFYAEASVERLLHAFTKRGESLGHADKARAARTVLAAATEGDEVAQGLVLTQAENFAKYALVTAARVGFDVASDEIPVVLGGGVLSDPASILRVHLVEALASALPHAAVIDSRNASPVLGSLLDAMAEGGVEITPAVQNAVLEQVPPRGLLDT